MENKREIKFKCLTECSDAHVKLGFPKTRWVNYGLSGKYLMPEYKQITPDLQYTGLKDKNGKDIYEGDFYEVAGNKEYQVKYCNGEESNHEWYGGCFILWLNEDVFFPFDEYAMKNGKVIGNIYQNSELLK